ncbi:MAG: NAD(P)-dependent oxidoreductase [Rhodobacteraceae bacterium]|nr:NAD(P)-dependent oxidoreductase [Paracoccaceae bacterium]
MAVGNVSVLGLGLMGSALARAMVSAGLDATVWNRSPSRAKEFIESPATVASSVEDAVDASEVIVVCLQDYAAMNDVLRMTTVEKRLAGKILVQLSTGTPAQAREASGWAASVGARYLDGSIMGFPKDIGSDGLLVLYGGDKETFEQCEPIAKAISGSTIRVGDDPGNGAALNNALISLYFSFLFGVLNGAAICDTEGIPLEKFGNIGTSLMPVLSGVMERSLKMITNGSYETELNTLETSAGSMKQLAAVVRDAEIDGRFVESMRAYATEALEAGKGNLSNAVLFEFLRGRGLDSS